MKKDERIERHLVFIIEQLVKGTQTYGFEDWSKTAELMMLSLLTMMLNFGVTENYVFQ